MLQIANQYSFLVAGLVLLLVTGILLAWRRRRFGAREAAILMVVTILIVVGWFASRPAATPLSSGDQIRDQLTGGKPLLMEFQSPY